MQQLLQQQPPSLEAILARNLVATRLRAGLTQFELAAAARISRATIAQLESGHSDPRLSTLVEIARALRISPLALLTDPRDRADHGPQAAPALPSAVVQSSHSLDSAGGDRSIDQPTPLRALRAARASAVPSAR